MEKKSINKLTDHVKLLKAIAAILLDNETASTSELADIFSRLGVMLTQMENTAQVDGSGINLEDLGGHGTIPFDSNLKLVYTDYDSVKETTYVGYATPETNPATGNYLIQKTVTTTSGDSEINTITYGTGPWDDRKTTVTYY